MNSGSQPNMQGVQQGHSYSRVVNHDFTELPQIEKSYAQHPQSISSNHINAYFPALIIPPQMQEVQQGYSQQILGFAETQQVQQSMLSNQNAFRTMSTGSHMQHQDIPSSSFNPYFPALIIQLITQLQEQILIHPPEIHGQIFDMLHTQLYIQQSSLQQQLKSQTQHQQQFTMPTLPQTLELSIVGNIPGIIDGRNILKFWLVIKNSGVPFPNTKDFSFKIKLMQVLENGVFQDVTEGALEDKGSKISKENCEIRIKFLKISSKYEKRSSFYLCVEVSSPSFTDKVVYSSNKFVVMSKLRKKNQNQKNGSNENEDGNESSEDDNESSENPPKRPKCDYENSSLRQHTDNRQVNHPPPGQPTQNQNGVINEVNVQGEATNNLDPNQVTGSETLPNSQEDAAQNSNDQNENSRPGFQVTPLFGISGESAPTPSEQIGTFELLDDNFPERFHQAQFNCDNFSP